MNKLVKNVAFLFRFAAALLFLAVLSPVSRTEQDLQSEFSRSVATIEGTPSIVIWKSHYTLTLYKGSVPVKTYRAVFGKGYADGDKVRTGDKRTPEGEYFICTMNHSKRFYKFMGISYPGLRHAASGLQKGIISPREYAEIQQAILDRRQPPWETKLGGAVGIHGRLLEPATPQDGRKNWTDGCIAMANKDVDEVFSVVNVGTPVIILP